MKLKTFKSLNYENFKYDAKKCLNPITKKLTKQIITLNAEKIKELFHSYDLTIIKNKNKTKEIIEENKEFKQRLDKYYAYKKYLDKKSKIKKNKPSILDILKRKYFKKRYKIPNFPRNIFSRNPLNYKGLDIREYFNELFRNNKKKISLKEKNLDFLSRLQEYVNYEKSKEKTPIHLIRKTLILSPKRKSSIIREKIKNINSPKKKIKLKNYKTIWNDLNNENKEENENKEYKMDNTSEKVKNIKIKRSSIFKDANFIYNVLNEEDEDFKYLNEYEKKHMIRLIQEEENLKDYKKFVNKALSNNNFFQVIDNDDSENESQDNSSKNNNLNKKITNIKLSIPSLNSKTKSTLSSGNSEESIFSSVNQEKSNNKTIDQNLIKLEINNENEKLTQKIKGTNSTNKKFKLRKSLTIRDFSDIKPSQGQPQILFPENTEDINKNKLSISINKNGIKIKNNK